MKPIKHGISKLVGNVCLLPTSPWEVMMKNETKATFSLSDESVVHLCTNCTATLFCNLQNEKEILEYIIFFYPKSTNSFILTLLGFGPIVLLQLQKREIEKFMTMTFGWDFYFIYKKTRLCCHCRTNKSSI